MQQDEGHLLRQAKSGNLAAYGELYERYSPGVYNLVFRMLGNADDAEDVKQDVFIRAHKALGSFKGDSKFSTWLYRIATNVCLDEIRRRKPQSSTDAMAEETSWEPTDQSVENNPGLLLDRKLTQEAVQMALLNMGANHRILVVLRHIEGLSYDEIAAVVGCSVNALNVRLHRAREVFRKAIAPYMVIEEQSDDLQSGQKSNIAIP